MIKCGCVLAWGCIAEHLDIQRHTNIRGDYENVKCIRITKTFVMYKVCLIKLSPIIIVL